MLLSFFIPSTLYSLLLVPPLNSSIFMFSIKIAFNSFPIPSSISLLSIKKSTCISIYFIFYILYSIFYILYSIFYILYFQYLYFNRANIFKIINYLIIIVIMVIVIIVIIVIMIIVIIVIMIIIMVI